ncbi:hypothetical protein ASC88_09000 [Rhizobacter sp. Root29]|nr:hypothetical protein ASC88_09000 [Rhizobacter sp. Root29]
MKLDLDPPSDDSAPTRMDVRTTEPQRLPVEDISGLQKLGIRLAWGVLGVIAVLAVTLISVVAYGEYSSPPAEVVAVQAVLKQAAAHYAAASSPDALRGVNDTVGKLVEMKRASRDFWTSYSQLLLLNMLLPVLTSILGYVFGTTRSNPS